VNSRVKIRFPREAGLFYERHTEPLKSQIKSCFLHKLGPGKEPKVNENGPRKILSLICPHAGYMYSGPVAGHSYYALAEDGVPDSIILIGPNHAGMGSGVSISVEGVWRTPLGDISIDSELAWKIQKASNIIDIDDTAHEFEHSIEVQIPFLQYLYGAVKFVPICMLMQDLDTSLEVGEAVAKAISGANAVIIASTDLTHYESKKSVETKDNLAIDAILKMDEVALQATVEKYSITMCGYGPVSVALAASKKLGAKNVVSLCHKTSGDITGDYAQVVGYASLVISR
jgi:hypothetical protein